jgi:subtilisin-like proprotein convertase family protein
MAFGQVQTENGAPLNGVQVRVWWDGARDDQVYSLPSGTDPTKPSGYWDVVLDDHAKEGRWYAQIFDRQTGRELSPKVTFETNAENCETGGSGHQVVEINFTRTGSEPIGTPAPTSTSTPVPSATRPPSATPTASSTPTITPTPTREPIAIANNEGVRVPDNGETAVSSVTVPDTDATVRYAVVFVNMFHPNAGDLEIVLVSPAGTRVVLHRRGQDSGVRNFQREFNPSNVPELESTLRGENAAGTWQLQVTDKAKDPPSATPTPEAELAQWELSIYP